MKTGATPMKKRREGFGPSILDVLEDRIVPSSGGLAVHASATGLASAGAEVQAAYSAFATSVRQSELALLPGASGTAASVSAQVSQEVSTLGNAIASAVQGVASGNAGSLLSRQLTGASPGSLASGLNQVILAASAGSAGGTVPPATLPLLFTAVDGAIAASLNSTAVEVSIDVAVHASGAGGTGSTGSPVNTAQYASRVNAGYAGFATSVRQAESALVGPGGATAAVNLAVVMGEQIQSLASTVAGAAGGASASVIRGQFLGSTPFALEYQLASLISASATGSADGSVPASSLPLLFTAIDAAIASSYNTSAVEGNLLAYAPPVSIMQLNGKGADTTLFSSYGVFFAF